MNLSKLHEESVVKSLKFDNARRSLSSGASSHDKIDVTTDNLVIECETTEKKSKSLKKDLWLESRMKAFGDRKPALALQFFDTNPRHKYDLIVVEVDFFTELLEAWIQKNS